MRHLLNICEIAQKCCFLLLCYRSALIYCLICACVCPDPAEMAQVAGNRTRKTVPRNVRSKRSLTSSREGHVQGSAEALKPEQRLVPSVNPSSPELTSPSTGTASPHFREVSNKNTDTAIVTNSNIKTKPSDMDPNSAELTGSAEDTSADLDEQTIMTYVLHLLY